MLWMEQYVIVSNKIGSALIFAASLGADVFPIILGQFIDKVPMLLMYLQVGVVIGCISCFTLASCLTHKLPPKI